MIVYWVAVIEILLYLSAIPMHIALYFRAGGDFAFSAAISLFESRFAKVRALRRLGRKKTPAAEKSSGPPLSGRTRLFLHILRYIRYTDIRFRANICMGDAASTALVCGSIRSIEYAIHPFFQKIHLDILPDFNGDKSHAEIQGMISLHAGQIIYAALSGAFKNANRRVTQWISIRLKAS